MIKKFFSARLPELSMMEDITNVWNRCHPHLQPLANAKVFGATPQGTFDVMARLRVAGGFWCGMTRVSYNPTTGRFAWSRSARESALTGRADLLKAPVDAVDARLWSAEPTMINIEPTTRCNFNCWYCVGRHMKQADIKLENFAAMLDNFPTVKTIALVGEGEPLMHKQFFVMARMATSRGIKVMIISNGSTLSQSVVRQLCESQVAYVAISIDSFDAATFAKSRIDGDLNKVWRGIRRLRTYRDAHGYRYPKIALKGTLFSHTSDQLPGIVEAAKENGVEIFESFQALNPMKSYVQIYPKHQLHELKMVPQVADAIATDSVPAAQALQPFSEFCRDESIDFFPDVNANPIRNNCNETYLYSLLSGDVTPCCQIKTPISEKWNVFTHAVKDVLSDPEYENMRFNLWNGIFADYCSGCWKTRQS